MSGDSEGTWWKTIGGGLLLIGLAVFLFWYFTDFEAAGGRRRIHWLVATAYNFGGKWLVCSVLGILGVVSVLFGIQEFRNRD